MKLTANGTGISAETLPGRKKPSLTLVNGNVHHLVATFKNEEAKNLFCDVLLQMMRLTGVTIEDVD